METAVTTHPMVLKAAREWLDACARHNVPATLEPMPADEYYAGGAYVRIDPNGRFGESASVQLYPPMRPGQRVSQTAIYLTYRIVQGEPRFGRKPKITLRQMRFNIANFWNREPKAAA